MKVYFRNAPQKMPKEIWFFLFQNGGKAALGLFFNLLFLKKQKSKNKIGFACFLKAADLSSFISQAMVVSQSGMPDLRLV